MINKYRHLHSNMCVGISVGSTEKYGAHNSSTLKKVWFSRNIIVIIFCI